MNRKTILTVLQVLATLGILAYLFRDPEQDRKMLEALKEADKGWIFAAIAVFGIVEICAVARWQTLLRVQGITISWLRLTALMMIGLFFNLFMPGGVGGDVVKVFYLLKETPVKQQPAALLAVLMDRIVGLLGLMAFAAIMITLRYRWLTQTPATAGLLYTLLVILGGSLGFIIVSFGLTRSGLVHKLPERTPLREKLLELAVAYNLYGRAWRSTLLALLLSAPVHFFSFLQYYCVARALPEAASKASLADFLAIMPIVNTIASMPVSISGAGVREGLFASLLGGLCGIPKATAVVLSLTGFSVLILWGLVGGIVYLFYRPTEHETLSTMEREFAVLEHKIAEGERAS